MYLASCHIKIACIKDKIPSLQVFSSEYNTRELTLQFSFFYDRCSLCEIVVLSHHIDNDNLLYVRTQYTLFTIGCKMLMRSAKLYILCNIVILFIQPFSVYQLRKALRPTCRPIVCIYINYINLHV